MNINNLLGLDVIEFKPSPQYLIDLIKRPAPDLKSDRVVSFLNKTREALFNLTKYIQPKLIVELGVREGYSTTAFSSAIAGTSTLLHSFDPEWRDDLFREENMERCYWVYHSITGEEGYNKFLDDITAIDLLYIDTDPHTYDQTSMWFTSNWIFNVRPGGYIVLDDCSPFFQEGVDVSRVPVVIEGYTLLNKGVWGVLQAILDFVEKQNDKIDYAFSVWNTCSPGTAIIKLKEGEKIT